MRLKIENITFSNILRDISLVVEKGITAILGANSSGKTLLFNIIAGLKKPDRGKVEVEGVDSPVTGLCFETPDDSLFLDTIYEEIAFAVKNYKKPLENVEKVIKYFGLKGDTSPHNLSYSEKKILTIASLIYEPQIILMDEPFRGLNKIMREKVKNFILRLKEKSEIILIFANYEGFPREICDNIFYLSKGRLIRIEKT